MVMRPGAESQAGFLGKEEKLLEVMAADNKKRRRRGDAVARFALDWASQHLGFGPARDGKAPTAVG
jgi:hypothetical protein